MHLIRLLTAPLFAAALVFGAAGFYCAPVQAQEPQNERSAHPKKPAAFHYICPMHEDVTSKKRGICRKCKMKLERKPVASKEPSSDSF